MSIKKKGIIGIVTAILLIIILVIVGKKELTGNKIFTVKNNIFELGITAKGEIQGKNAILISLPDDLKHRDLRIHEFQIKDLIEEGRKVKKDDWIATLDIASITQQAQENNDDLERRRAEFNDAKIDSAITLTSLREELKEFKYDLEYKELELEQAKFESPAYQRKAKVAYDKTLRQMAKKRRDYELRKLDLKVRTKRIEDRYTYHLRRDSLLKRAVVAARITAPQDGMVMYARLWGGRKLKIGDYISQWNPAIANLPDMSQLVSETYVEEIHITKVETGDSVKVSIDAIPGKVFPGVISKIANIGQELSGFESKVFKVIIDLKDTDPNLKPGMTSNNNIIINHIPDVLTIPRECLFTENKQAFVYLRKSGKVWKKEVTPGIENDKEIIIQSGLEKNDKIFYSPPDNLEKIEYFKSLSQN
jgi:multidrug efflux pump subunit AcrA (membrane-fusion protein)